MTFENNVSLLGSHYSVVISAQFSIHRRKFCVMSSDFAKYQPTKKEIKLDYFWGNKTWLERGYDPLLCWSVAKSFERNSDAMRQAILRMSTKKYFLTYNYELCSRDIGSSLHDFVFNLKFHSFDRNVSKLFTCYSRCFFREYKITIYYITIAKK